MGARWSSGYGSGSGACMGGASRRNWSGMSVDRGSSILCAERGVSCVACL